jgi:hypothetical protein
MTTLQKLPQENPRAVLMKQLVDLPCFDCFALFPRSRRINYQFASVGPLLQILPYVLLQQHESSPVAQVLAEKMVSQGYEPHPSIAFDNRIYPELFEPLCALFPNTCGPNAVDYVFSDTSRGITPLMDEASFQELKHLRNFIQNYAADPKYCNAAGFSVAAASILNQNSWIFWCRRSWWTSPT